MTPCRGLLSITSRFLQLCGVRGPGKVTWLRLGRRRWKSSADIFSLSVSIYVLWLLFSYSKPLIIFMKEEWLSFAVWLSLLMKMWRISGCSWGTPSLQICLCLYCKLNPPETSRKWGFCCRKEWKWDLAQSNCCAFFHDEWMNKPLFNASLCLGWVWLEMGSLGPLCNFCLWFTVKEINALNLLGNSLHFYWILPACTGDCMHTIHNVRNSLVTPIKLYLVFYFPFETTFDVQHNSVLFAFPL